MIAAAFEYHRPADLKGALGVLAEYGDDARVLAGGHSLIPMMKLRMASVDHLVDLQDIAELKGISVAGGRVTIGAMTTQHEMITNADLSRAAPIIAEAAVQIADPQVRYMGTVGGKVAARDFYQSAYVTAREDGEILTQISFAAPMGGYAYEKQKRKIGDYATAACAVQLTKAGGKVTSAAIAMTNLSDTPVFSEAAGAALVGTTGDAAAVKAAVTAAVAAINPTGDNRGPAEFKRHIAGIIIGRAITRALSRA
jgi:carbon-monoxide dehydrogenase medium subunit